jgi:exosortase
MINPRKHNPFVYPLLAGMTVCLLWAYWPTFREMAHRWVHEPQYSHGYLVPVFALFLLWTRRDQLGKIDLGPSWWGLAFLAVGGALRLSAARFYVEFLDGLSLLPTLAGLALLAGGWPALRWSWPGIAFLAFMLPLPFTVERLLSHPLQRIGTLASTYTLQTIGLPALSEGNTILVNEHHIGVVEACSGLSMLMIFFALSTAFVIVIRRPILDKLILLASAIPIAILSNVIRITVTAMLFETASSEWANKFYHDYAGYLMMPLALGFLALEMWLLDHLLMEPEKAQLMTLGLPSGAKAAAVQSQPKAGVQPTA